MLSFIVSGTLQDVFATPVTTSEIKTPFSSEQVTISTHEVQNIKVLVLSRHGTGHLTPAHRVNYRANLWALQEAGATQVIATATTGSVNANFVPGRFLVLDQIIDYTQGRTNSFETEGIPEHFDFSYPFSEHLRLALLSSAVTAGIECHDGGTYACTQGPRYETAAEINRCRRDGCDVVGMTLMPEAPLARQIGLPYAALALVMNPGAGINGQPVDIPGSTQFTDQAVKPLQKWFEALVQSSDQLR